MDIGMSTKNSLAFLRMQVQQFTLPAPVGVALVCAHPEVKAAHSDIIP